jgi:hypothetical protein
MDYKALRLLLRVTKDSLPPVSAKKIRAVEVEAACFCHPERSEGSRKYEILRFAQNDIAL